MKLVISDEDKLDSWEMLINDIEKTDIPIEFVRCIDITFIESYNDETEKSIDIQLLREHGWEDDEINLIVEQILQENNNHIKTVHFYLDVRHVAAVVQHQTNILLKGTT